MSRLLLELRGIGRGPFRGRTVLPLIRSPLRVGRGGANDIVLLDPDVAETAGSIETSGVLVCWRSPQGETVDLQRKGVRIGRYSIRARRSGWHRLVFAGTGVLAGGALALTLEGRWGDAAAGRADADIPLPARGVYGRMSEEASWPAPLLFRFDHAGKGAVLLHYLPGGVLRAGQLRIDLNGTTVGVVPPCRHGWGVEQRLLLPASRLLFGANRVSFVPERRSDEVGRWGVRDIYVTAVPFGIEEGEEGEALLDAARKLYREGGGNPAQLAHSARILRNAIERFHFETGKVPDEALDLQREIAGARSDLRLKWISEAKKAASLGEKERSDRIYRGLLGEGALPP